MLAFSLGQLCSSGRDEDEDQPNNDGGKRRVTFPLLVGLAGGDL